MPLGNERERTNAAVAQFGGCECLRAMSERERELMPQWHRDIAEVAQFGGCECLRAMRERELTPQWHSLVGVNAFGQ